MVVATSDPAEVVCAEESLPPIRASTLLASEQKIAPMVTGSGPNDEALDCVNDLPRTCVP